MVRPEILRHVDIREFAHTVILYSDEFFFFFGSIYIPAYMYLTKPGRS
jgi:hypothetical protein